MIVDNPYIVIFLAAFLLNIPFGYLREGSPKFSGKWFLWIHASIPFLVYLRIMLHTSKFFIPMAILAAVLGQIIGSRYRRKKMTLPEREKMEQIPDLRLKVNAQNIPDSDIAVVLMNMGGPKNIEGVKPFLRRLFLDARILRFPLAAVLQPFFAWLIVTLRAKVTEHRYSLIGGGSPIFQSTTEQAKALEAELKKRGSNISVSFCFNYSDPLPGETIMKLKSENKKYILPLSLYPHYSEATTGSNLFYLKEEAKRNYPEAVFLESREYYLDGQYIEAFAERIRSQIKPGERLEDFYLLFSTHGLPLYFLTEGDPYPYQIAQTVAKVLDRLGRTERWVISYQSAVGPLQWLQPSTDSMIQALARRNEKKLLVVPISFVTDHIETLCEIDIEYRQMAKSAGIEDFRMSRALECHPLFIRALADCVENSLGKTSHKQKLQNGHKEGIYVNV